MEKFKFIGGSKIPEIEITNPNEYSTSVRAKDLNDIADKLNEIIDITDNHISANIASNNTLGHIKVDNNTIKINENGIISANIPSSYITEDDVKDIISGEISKINTGGMSIGTIFAYASSNPPAGALVLSRTNY